MPDPYYIIVGSLWSLACAAAGWQANRRFSNERDRRNRRLALLQALKEGRSKIERFSAADFQGIFDCYRSWVHEFHGKLGVVQADRPKDKDLVSLGEALGAIQYSAIQNPTGGTDRRDVICKPMDDLIGHLKKIKDYEG